MPEALHQVTIVMSDRGIPKSYRHMHGFGSHTYSLINANNERFWVKFHFRTQQGIENLTDTEAAAVIAGDRESSQRDLFDSIEQGNFPKWKLQVQVMPEVDAEKVSYHPFDLTKIWPHADYPMIDVGEFELNRNSENYFSQWQEQPELKEPPLKISGDADHWDFRQDDSDYFSQPRALFNLMSAKQQQALFDNTGRAMGDALDFIKYRHIRNCYACDAAYGEGVAQALGMSVAVAQAARATDPAHGNPSLL